MKNQNITPAKVALSFGVLLGGVSVIFGLILYALEMHYQNDKTTSLIGYSFLIGIIILGMVYFRQNNNGFLMLSDALKTGVGIALISSLIVSLYTIVLTQYVDPEFLDKAIEFQKQKILLDNPEISVENINKMFDPQKENSGPFIISGFIIIFNLFFGFIISLIVGLILKKTQPE